MKSWKTTLAIAMLLAVLAVSSYDTYRCVTDAEVLYDVEVNPMARWLIKLDGGRIALLLAWKMSGTGIVAAVEGWLISAEKWRMVWPSLSALCLMQLFVLCRLVV